MEAITSNKFTTIHLVAEVAIMSGMFYYFNKKINKLEKENEHIKKTYVDTFEDVYKKIELLKEGIVELEKQQLIKTQSHQNINKTMHEANTYTNTNHNLSTVSNIQTNKKETTSKQENKIKPTLVKIEVPINTPVLEKIQEEITEFNNISNNILDFFQGTNTTHISNISDFSEPAKVEVIDDDNKDSEENNEVKNEVKNEENNDISNDELSATDFDEINKLLEKDTQKVEKVNEVEKIETKNKTE